MPWADFSDRRNSVSLLQRSLDRGRLGHAYLFSGEDPRLLNGIATELAATVLCTGTTRRSANGVPTQACGQCSQCRRVRSEVHPDVHWLRAESKSRVIRVEQVRELIHAVQLKPTEGGYKVGILADADRLHPNAANGFLKTLEEPPARSLLILLTTEPDRVLETLVSRCLRLTFPGGGGTSVEAAGWLRSLTGEVAKPQKSLLARYRVLGILLARFEEIRGEVEQEVGARSPAQRYGEVNPEIEEQWENEAKAAMEGEFRRRRGETIQVFQTWLRDLWLQSLGQPEELLALPALAQTTREVARRLDPERAMANLQLIEQTQALLQTNVQESLALEVALLRLSL